MVRLSGLLPIAWVVLLASCDQSANRVSTLWTNVPEMAAVVEKFNASQREWQLLVEYREDPASLDSTSAKADLFVVRGLASTSLKSSLVSLDSLFDGGTLSKAAFYQHILEAGREGDHQKLLPVSFDLPILVFAEEKLPHLPGFSLSLSDLKARNDEFNDLETSRGSHLAFSPLWGAFGPTFLQWAGARFHEGFTAELAWDSGGLVQGLQQLHSWAPRDRDLEVRRKYLQTDAGPWLKSGKLQFYPSTLSTFMNRPWMGRRGLDFRFLEAGGKVLATESMVWAGIPSSSMTRGAAERFLTWLFQTGNQERLIEASRKEDDRVFGLAQGLSALTSPNVRQVPAVYPELEGRLPTSDQLVFWPSLPPDWDTLKTSILIPWLDSNQPSEADLKERLEKHRLHPEGR